MVKLNLFEKFLFKSKAKRNKRNKISLDYGLSFQLLRRSLHDCVVMRKVYVRLPNTEKYMLEAILLAVV